MAGREDEVFEELKALQAKGCNDLLCRNLAHIGLGRKLGMNLHGGWELNVTNARSLAALRDLGLRDCVLSPELTAKQCPEAGIPVGRLIYGRLPVMLLTRCPVRDDAPRKNCKDCRPLTDRTGRSFPLRCDGHSVEVLNADPLWMGDRLDELKADFFVALDEIPEAPFDKFTRGAYTRGVE
jgi:putative protease